MSNHVHLIARAKEGFVLSHIIRDFKKFTSKEIAKTIFELAKAEENGFCKLILKPKDQAGQRIIRFGKMIIIPFDLKKQNGQFKG